MKAVNNDDGRIMLVLSEKVVRLMEYFKMLLNGDVPKNPVSRWDEQKAEQDNVGKITFEKPR